jgi:PhoU domain
MIERVVLAPSAVDPADVERTAERKQAADPTLPRYLDEGAVDAPSLAITNAARETLRMGDCIETMLTQVMTAIMANDRKLAGEVSKADNIVDRLTEAIKLYIAKLTRGSLDEREGRRAMEIVSFAINLEHIGDIIDKSLCELAVKKSKRQQQFSLPSPIAHVLRYETSVRSRFRANSKPNPGNSAPQRVSPASGASRQVQQARECRAKFAQART